MTRLELHETGLSEVGGVRVGASNIGRREPWTRSGPVAVYAQVTVEEDPPVEISEGETVAIAGVDWRVALIVEDPEHHRGTVILERD